MTLGILRETKDGSLTLEHPELGECYHSHMGAKEEATSLYVRASGYDARLKTAKAGTTLQILDVGLGLGYNALATIAAWWQNTIPVNLILESLEFNNELLQTLLSGSPPWATGWDKEWTGWLQNFTNPSPDTYVRTFTAPHGGQCQWTIHLGDASAGHFLEERLTQGLSFDFIWQDPFSPQKNPSMWSASWFQSLKPYTHQGSILVTYSVARVVRDHLGEAGWLCERIPTSTVSKKHWLRAQPQSTGGKN